jgi:chromosomal replication initiator protein
VHQNALRGRRDSLPEDLNTTWDTIRSEIREAVTDFTFHVWLEPLAAAGRDGDTLYIRAPDHVRGWVRERFSPMLDRAAAHALGGRARVQLVDESWEAPTRAELPPQPANGPASTGLNPKYTFEQFVICDGNRFAHAAALAVAELPGQAYNPLFLHGPPGLGKTHLLHAIGNYIARYGDGMTVRYATVEEFTTQFVGAVRGQGLSAFKESFRGADVLLIDDIQFLAAKVRTEEEFFHTFNALYESGRQLVFTSDRAPADLAGLADRLRERFACGLVAGVETPDPVAREVILRKRIAHDGVTGIGDDAVRELAHRVSTSVRALEGGLIRVVAHASLRGEPVTPETVRRVIGHRPEPAPGPEATVERIQSAAAAQFGFSRERLLARDRTPQVALARQIAMYLARELTDETLPAIGRSFGGRNHATVLHAYRRVAAEVQAGGESRRTVDLLKEQLTGGASDRAC